jgi:hypothetical protein
MTKVRDIMTSDPRHIDESRVGDLVAAISD